MSVCTAIPKDRRKIEKAGYRLYRVSTQAGKPIGWFYRIPLAEFRWRAGGKRRQVSEGQRQAARERFARARPGGAPDGPQDGFSGEFLHVHVESEHRSPGERATGHGVADASEQGQNRCRWAVPTWNYGERGWPAEGPHAVRSRQDE